MNLTTDSAKAVAILAAVALGAFVAWKLYKGAGAVGDFAATTLNPLSDQNAVYRLFDTTNAQGEVTGSLGTGIYDATHHSDGSWRWPWEDHR